MATANTTLTLPDIVKVVLPVLGRTGIVVASYGAHLSLSHLWLISDLHSAILATETQSKRSRNPLE